MPESVRPPKIGAYQLLARIGEGGMGVVHLAQGPDGQRVAIKLLRAHVVGDDQGRARMAREVTSLRRVRSPRVAEVYDADPWGDMPYVVTRYVPGLSLHDHVERQGPIRDEDLDVFARGLAEAIAAVHLADVLHRDVKPSNVLIEGRNPVLIDFGLAQLSDDARLTHTGWLLGTPGYLAPEILYGADPTPKADVHSWAATVVFAASGKGPYGKGPAVAVMDRIRRGEHDLSAVPESLMWMVTRALARDPRERPTAQQLVDWMVASPIGTASSRVSIAPPAEPAPQGAAPTQAPAPQGGYSPTPWSAYEERRHRVVDSVLWSLMLALVVSGAMTSPAVTAVCVFVGAWFLRTLTLRLRRLEDWRRERGVRRNDGLLATLCMPWFGTLSFPAAFVNAGVAIVDGAIVVVIAVLTAGPEPLALMLAAGGLVAGLFVWWGPLSEDVRAGGVMVTRTLLQPGAATVMVLALVAVASVVLLGVLIATGAHYWPFPDPPWEQSLRNLVP